MHIQLRLTIRYSATRDRTQREPSVSTVSTVNHNTTKGKRRDSPFLSSLFLSPAL